MRGLLRRVVMVTLVLIVSCAVGLVAAPVCRAGFTPVTTGGDNRWLFVNERWAAWQDYDSGSIRVLRLADDSRHDIPVSGEDWFGEIGLAGDWVCYVQYRHNDEYGSTLPVFEARNLLTGVTRVLVPPDVSGAEWPVRSWVAAEHWVVWVETVGLPDESTERRVRVCDLDTGTTRTLSSVTTVESGLPLLDQGQSDIHDGLLVWDPQDERNAADEQVAVVVRVTDLATGQERRVRVPGDDYVHVYPQWVGDRLLVVRERHTSAPYAGTDCVALDISTGATTTVFRLAPNGIGERVISPSPFGTSGLVFSGDWLVCQGKISANTTESLYAIDTRTGAWRSLGREPRDVSRFSVAGDRVFVWGDSSDYTAGGTIFEGRISTGRPIRRFSLSKSPSASQVRLRIRKVPGVRDYVAPSYTLVATLKVGGTAVKRHRVYLERSYDGRTWSSVGSGLTDSQGRLRARLPNVLGMLGYVAWRAPTTLYFRFRVDPVEGQTRGAYSATTRITTYR